VVDALQAHSIVFDGHADDSFIGVYILPKEGRQDVIRTMTLAFCRTERLETCGNDGGVRLTCTQQTAQDWPGELDGHRITVAYASNSSSGSRCEKFRAALGGYGSSGSAGLRPYLVGRQRHGFGKSPWRLSHHHGGSGCAYDQDQNRCGADAAGFEKSRLAGACACNPGCDLERADYSRRQRGTGPRLYSTPICGLWSPASRKGRTPE